MWNHICQDRGGDGDGHLEAGARKADNNQEGKADQDPHVHSQIERLLDLCSCSLTSVNSSAAPEGAH